MTTDTVMRDEDRAWYDLAPLARLDAAKVDRDRVARMLEDGVDAARALRAEREATKGSANAR